MEDEIDIVLTDEAIEIARQAIELFKEGYTLAQIAEHLDVPIPEGGDKVFSLRMLIAIANMTGVLD